jgi:hypothetical protein
MPNYILNSWKKDGDDVYLKLFGSTLFKKDGVLIEERTNFPYENNIRLTVKTQKQFRLRLRLPKWNEGYTIKVDGYAVETVVENGFVVLLVNKDCNIEYDINCSIVKHADKDYVWFSKGAMVYTHKVKALWKIDRGDHRSSRNFPSYNVYPVESWNYGVKEGAVVIEDGGRVFVPAYVVENWQLEVSGQRSRLPAPPKSPVVNNTHHKLIELTPYGLSECRITAFAKIKKD